MSSTTRGRSWSGTLFMLGLSACNLVGYDPQLDTASVEAGRDLEPDRFTPLGDGGVSTMQDAHFVDAASVSDAQQTDTRPGDAAADAAKLADGWWEGVVPSTPCKSDQSCYPECASTSQPCVIDCQDASECEPKCLPETGCKIDCGSTEDCRMSCKADAQCWFDCAGADTCSAYCTSGSTCEVDCTGAGSCDVQCLAGASCDVDCEGDVDCSGYVCSPGAQCLMHCGDEGCDFDCQGTGSSCPDNHEVCNRACP